jgi:hypothetical protein
MRNSSAWVAFINILFMMPYFVISDGQQTGQAGCGRRGRAGQISTECAAQGARKREAHMLRKGPIAFDLAGQNTDHCYPAAKPLWCSRRYAVLAAKWIQVSRSAKPKIQNNHDKSEAYRGRDSLVARVESSSIALAGR